MTPIRLPLIVKGARIKALGLGFCVQPKLAMAHPGCANMTEITPEVLWTQ